MTNKINSVVYIGMTNDLFRRVCEHKSGLIEGFTKKYNLKKLVYYEWCSDINSVISREKQLKGWTRKRKNKLIESMNPNWKELELQ